MIVCEAKGLNRSSLEWLLAAGDKSLAYQVVEYRQALFTFDDDENRSLLEIGTRPYQFEEVRSLMARERSPREA